MLAADLVLDSGLTIVARLGLRVYAEATVEQCFKKMRVLTHPDKSSPDHKPRAEEAFKKLDDLLEIANLMDPATLDMTRRVFLRGPREEALFPELRSPTPEPTPTPPPEAAAPKVSGPTTAPPPKAAAPKASGPTPAPPPKAAAPKTSGPEPTAAPKASGPEPTAAPKAAPEPAPKAACINRQAQEG